MRATFHAYVENDHSLANPQDGQLPAMLGGLMAGMYVNVDKPIVFDKNRSWPMPFNIKMVERVIGHRPKIICPVRPIADILASWLVVMKRNDQESKLDADAIRLGYPLTDVGRCQYLMSPRGNVGEAWTHIKDTLGSDYSDCLLFVEYDDLISDPQPQLDRIHDFIGLDHYQYDFDNIVPPVIEDDAAYGITDLHKVRPAMQKLSTPAIEVLGPALYGLYAGGELWHREHGPLPSLG